MEKKDYKDSVERFQKAIRIDTISYSEKDKIDYEKFKKYIELIKFSYKLVHQHLDLTMINEYNFLYEWKGKNEKLKPILLMAHYDVVPVEDESKWVHPPFSGDFDGKFIWGRGSQDDKLSMIGILESVEALLKEEFVPERTVYLAFGHDEEIGGYSGAKLIKQYFVKKKIIFEYVIDEGSIIAKGMFPGIEKPIALIGVAEKGHVNIEISVKGTGGHASMPPKHTAAGKIAKIVTLIEDNPMSARITNTLKNMLYVLGDYSSFAKKVIFKNSDLFKNLILKFFSNSPTTNALVRTTTAVTMLKGSSKENILPQSSYARVNIRLLYPDTVKSVIERLRKITKKVVKNEDEFDIRIVDEEDISEASKEADLNSIGYKAIKEIVEKMVKDVIVSPFIVVGATDSRYYDDIADNVFKFMPVVMEKDDFKMIHGNNEKVKIEDFINVIRFYKELIKMTC